MENYWWYIILAFISSLLFIFSFWQERDSRLIALYFFMSGLVYAFEYLVLVLLEGYIYYPGILKNHYFDNIMGAVFSNAFYVPAITLLIVVMRYGFTGMIIAALTSMGIEWLFLKLGIYRHNWWNTLYTGIGLMIFFNICRYWYSLMRKSPQGFNTLLNLYLAGLGLLANFFFIMAALLESHLYSIGWFEHPIRDHVAFATAYIAFLSLLLVAMVRFGYGWVFKSAVILVMTAGDWLLMKLHILHTTGLWPVAGHGLSYFITIAALAYLQRIIVEDWPLFPDLRRL